MSSAITGYMYGILPLLSSTLPCGTVLLVKCQLENTGLLLSSCIFIHHILCKHLDKQCPASRQWVQQIRTATHTTAVFLIHIQLITDTFCFASRHSSEFVCVKKINSFSTSPVGVICIIRKTHFFLYCQISLLLNRHSRARAKEVNNCPTRRDCIQFIILMIAWPCIAV